MMRCYGKRYFIGVAYNSWSRVIAVFFLSFFLYFLLITPQSEQSKKIHKPFPYGTVTFSSFSLCALLHAWVLGGEEAPCHTFRALLHAWVMGGEAPSHITLKRFSLLLLRRPRKIA